MLWLAVLGLAVLVVLLMTQNASLRRVIGEQDARLLVRATEDGLEVGDRVGSLALFDASGVISELVFGDGEPAAVVFMVSAGCAACDFVLPDWDTMVEGGLSGARAVVVDVVAADASALEPKSALIPWHGAQGTGWLRGVSVTPSVVLVRGDGEVVGVWSGNVASRRVDEISDLVLDAMLGG